MKKSNCLNASIGAMVCSILVASFSSDVVLSVLFAVIAIISAVVFVGYLTSFLNESEKRMSEMLSKTQKEIDNTTKIADDNAWNIGAITHALRKPKFSNGKKLGVDILSSYPRYNSASIDYMYNISIDGNVMSGVTENNLENILSDAKRASKK